VALTTGVLQLWLGFTGRTRRLHRLLGRVYVTGVLCGAIAGLYMAATIPPPGGFYASGLVGLEIAWIITTSIAYISICRGAVALDREWMVRTRSIAATEPRPGRRSGRTHESLEIAARL
jgi:uncharacterized membrane protein